MYLRSSWEWERDKEGTEPPDDPALEPAAVALAWFEMHQMDMSPTLPACTETWVSSQPLRPGLADANQDDLITGQDT